MINNKKIGIVILAAGSSSRLGKPKQLVKFNNKPLLQHIMEITKNLDFDSKILVLGAHAEEILKSVGQDDFEIVYNENWEEGMASSIRKGIQSSLALQNDLKYLMILVSDQPLISKENLEKLIATQLHKEPEATFSEYDGNVGVPAIFSREVFSELQKLKGDHGAKKLLSEGKLSYETVKFKGGNFDVDTKEDVERLKRMEE